MQAFYEILLQKTFLAHSDGLSGTDIVTANAVQVADLLNGYAIAGCYASKCFARLDFVILGSLGIGAAIAYGYGGTPYGQSNEPKGKAPEDPFAEFGSSTGEKSEQNGGSSNSSDGFFN